MMGLDLASGLSYRSSVIVSRDSALLESAAEHEERRWMRGRAYHRRIQKKWDKRFGLVDRGRYIVIGRGLGTRIVMSPKAYDQLQKVVKPGSPGLGAANN